LLLCLLNIDFDCFAIRFQFVSSVYKLFMLNVIIESITFEKYNSYTVHSTIKTNTYTTRFSDQKYAFVGKSIRVSKL